MRRGPCDVCRVAGERQIVRIIGHVGKVRKTDALRLEAKGRDQQRGIDGARRQRRKRAAVVPAKIMSYSPGLTPFGIKVRSR